MVDFVTSIDDLFSLLDDLAHKRLDAGWWDRFYVDRQRPIPFFVDKPSEHLVRLFEAGAVSAGRALDLGCGNGRDAVYLAQRGCAVDAVDFALEPLKWGAELARRAGCEVNFIHASIFDLELPTHGYDLINDSGCFHHLTPHRRISYLALVSRILKPGGKLVLCCMSTDMAPAGSDRTVYETGDPGGERGYSPDELRAIFEHRFDVVMLRRMAEELDASPMFGKAFCWTALLRRRVTPRGSPS